MAVLRGMMCCVVQVAVFIVALQCWVLIRERWKTIDDGRALPKTDVSPPLMCV